jgi:hypothetical protein
MTRLGELLKERPRLLGFATLALASFVAAGNPAYDGTRGWEREYRAGGETVSIATVEQAEGVKARGNKAVQEVKQFAAQMDAADLAQVEEMRKKTQLAANSFHSFSMPGNEADGKYQSGAQLAGYVGQLIERGVVLQHAAWGLQEWEMAVRSERPDDAEQARADLAELLDRVLPDGSLKDDGNYVVAENSPRPSL